jgi:hypothetical protein
MFRKGWFTSLTTQPKALHLMLSPFHEQVTRTYLNDLKVSVGEARAETAPNAVFEARYS